MRASPRELEPDPTLQEGEEENPQEPDQQWPEGQKEIGSGALLEAKGTVRFFQGEDGGQLWSAGRDRTPPSALQGAHPWSGRVGAAAGRGLSRMELDGGEAIGGSGADISELVWL